MTGEVRKLREGPQGPVFGVRAEIECSCGRRFPATLTVGVARPALWCPWCKGRSVLHIEWRVEGALREGARVAWRLR